MPLEEMPLEEMPLEEMPLEEMPLAYTHYAHYAHAMHTCTAYMHSIHALTFTLSISPAAWNGMARIQRLYATSLPLHRLGFLSYFPYFTPLGTEWPRIQRRYATSPRLHLYTLWLPLLLQFKYLGTLPFVNDPLLGPKAVAGMLMFSTVMGVQVRAVGWL
jgi:hypothetical protein